MSSAFIAILRKTALASCPRAPHKGLSGRESAPGAREKRNLARATRVTRNGRLLSRAAGAEDREARSSAGWRGQFVDRAGGGAGLGTAGSCLGVDPKRPSPRPWGPHLRRLAEAGRARRVRARQRRSRPRHAEPVHGRLGALAFWRTPGAGVEDGASDR